MTEICGSNSAVECQLPKLNVAGSIPVSRSSKITHERFFVSGCNFQNPAKGGISYGRLAQLVQSAALTRRRSKVRTLQRPHSIILPKKRWDAQNPNHSLENIRRRFWHKVDVEGSSQCSPSGQHPLIKKIPVQILSAR